MRDPIKDAACKVISKLTRTIKKPEILRDTREGFDHWAGPPVVAKGDTEPKNVKNAEHDCAKTHPDMTHEMWSEVEKKKKKQEKKAQGAPVSSAQGAMNAARPSPPRPQPLPMHKNTGDPSVGKNHPKPPNRQMGQYPGGFFPNIGTFMRRTFTPKSYWNNERAQQRAGLPNTEGSIQAHRRSLSPRAQKIIAEQKAQSAQRTQAAAARQQPLNLDESPPPATKVQEAPINPPPPSPRRVNPTVVTPGPGPGLDPKNLPASLRGDDTGQKAIERLDNRNRRSTQGGAAQFSVPPAAAPSDQ